MTQSGREPGQKYHLSSGKCCSRHEPQTTLWAEGVEWRWELELGLVMSKQYAMMQCHRYRFL